MAPVKVDNALVAGNAAVLAQRLADLGCDANSRVAVYCANGLEFIIARAAIARLGAVAVPVNPKLAAAEVRYVLEHSAAAAVLVDAGRQSRADDVATVPVAVVAVDPSATTAAPDHAAVGATLIYTSGTTGLPKGCMRLESQELARARELIDTYSLSRNDVHLIACPLAHSAPGIFLRAGRLVDATTYIMERFRAEEFLQAVEQTRATFFFLVPTQYARMLALPDHVRARYDTSSIRAALVAGAPITPGNKQRIVHWLGPGKLWEFYGSSETGTVAVLPPAEQLSRIGSVGQPPPSVELNLRTEQGEPVATGGVGEIFVRSPTLMDGYIDQPVTNRDGFISVGDLGKVDDDGYLYLVDRKHDTIISGGLNVYPAEVERALHDHDAVTGAVVFGVQDADWGQIVAAAVAVDDSEITGAALREFLRDKIAPYKLPKAIALVAQDELPIGASGKPLRRAARELLAGNQRLVRCD